MKIEVQGYHRLTMDDLNQTGCLNLLTAFVKDVGMEYRSALVNYRNNKSKDASEHLKKIRSYIASDYFSQLTTLDGTALISSLDRYYNKRTNIQI